MVSLAALAKLLTGTNDVVHLPSSIRAVLTTVTLTTYPFTTVPTINWVYWSLSFELAFYAVMAVLLLAPTKCRPSALAATHILLCLAACRPDWPRPSFWSFVELWPLFGTGAALVMWRGHRRLALAMLLASSVHATVSLGQGRLAAYWLTASLGTAACAFLLARRLPPLPPSLVRLGEMSYTMYLLHIPIGIYLFGKLLPSFGPTSLSEILRQGVVVFSTVILIRPFFLHLERPLLVSPADFTALPVFPVPDE